MRTDAPDLFTMNTPPSPSTAAAAPLAELRSSGHSLSGLAAPDPAFEAIFLDELGAHGPASASVVRARRKIPPSSSIGATIRALAARGAIFPVGFVPSITPEANGRIERVWSLTAAAPGGGA